MAKWTREQWEAINASDSNFIVSAGAGSGKTAVLTERVFQLLLKGTKLNELLVLTFTNAAAFEMKNRIRKRVLETPELSPLASQIETSDISTFDAYALSLVKRYHFLLNVSREVSIIDESIITIKKRQILEEIFAARYQKRDPDFLNVISKYVIRKDDDVKEYLLRIDALGDLKIDKKAFFETYLENHYQEKRVSENINEFVDFVKRICVEIVEKANGFEDSLMSSQVSDAFLPIINSVDYPVFHSALLNFQFPSSKGLSDEDKEIHSMLKKGVEKFPFFAALGTQEQIVSRFFETKPIVSVLLDILKEMNVRLDDFKHEHDVFTFNDIAKMALQIVSKTIAGQEIKKQLKYIMIDEYQDTSDIQEAFISYIANDNVFMVGDIKQSIYRFRNANSRIFADKYDQYGKNNGGKKIDLNKNFRSRNEIINDINFLFSKLMTRNMGGADYSSGHIIEVGNLDFSTSGNNHKDNHIECLRYGVEDGKDKTDSEVEIIASDIINKINGEYPIYDNEVKKLRPISFHDFAILIDRKTKFDTYLKVFSKLGIPLKVEKDDDLANSDVLLVFQNLLRLLLAVTNDCYDATFNHAFVSVARSFLCRYTDQKIYDIVNKNDYLKQPLMEKIMLVSQKIRNYPLSQILTALVDEFEIFENLVLVGNVMANIHKIESFIETSKMMETIGYGLESYVKYFDDLQTYQVPLNSSISEDPGDCVRLMSIHKSKGLEFRIIYYPGLSSEFNNPDIRSSFLTSNDYGIILPIIDDSEASNIYHYLVKERERQDELSERIRLFYVALTRAQEKIIILLPELEKNQIISIQYAKSFYDFLHLYSFESKFGHQIKYQPSSLIKVVKEQKEIEVKFSKLNIQSTVIPHQRASKDLTADFDEENIRFGLRMHRLLEIVDFASKDTTFIEDLSDRHFIEKALSSIIFSKAREAKILKEYQFYDEKQDIHGIIDLLLIYSDHIDIIDYKLKNIQDPSYLDQVDVYKKYIGSQTKLKINCYLLSVITGEVKQILI